MGRAITIYSCNSLGCSLNQVIFTPYTNTKMAILRPKWAIFRPKKAVYKKRSGYLQHVVGPNFQNLTPKLQSFRIFFGRNPTGSPNFGISGGQQRNSVCPGLYVLMIDAKGVTLWVMYGVMLPATLLAISIWIHGLSFWILGG